MVVELRRHVRCLSFWIIMLYVFLEDVVGRFEGLYVRESKLLGLHCVLKE